MAFDPQANHVNFLGFVLWGDIADFTVYRSSRGKVVWLKKTWPEKPASPKQLAVREEWISGAQAWRRLCPDRRRQWTLAARRASLCATGYNLWMHCRLTHDHAAIRTLERQTSTTLLPCCDDSSASS